MSDEERSYDYLAPEVVAARDAVGKAIAEYLRVIRADDSPFVVAWAVGVI